jgi:divalent metal cation (Fe/Co/Zn/Cd) transporter
MNAATLPAPVYYRWALGLAVFTIAYNLAEGVIATAFGYSDETLALFGFGLDSFIEMISGAGIVVMVLRIQRNPASVRTPFENTALRITGVSFFLLTAGLVAGATASCFLGSRPETTLWGVIISAVSILVMLGLIYGKMKTGNALQSAPLLADANCTKVCIYMSVVLLASSAIYELTGFAYADAIGTFALASLAFKEGKECFRKAKSNTHCACGFD